MNSEESVNKISLNKNENETKTTEIHNKNVNVVVINNILTKPNCSKEYM